MTVCGLMVIIATVFTLTRRASIEDFGNAFARPLAAHSWMMLQMMPLACGFEECVISALSRPSWTLMGLALIVRRRQPWLLLLLLLLPLWLWLFSLPLLSPWLLFLASVTLQLPKKSTRHPRADTRMAGTTSGHRARPSKLQKREPHLSSWWDST